MYKFLQSIPSRLTRITSGGKLIKEIDGLRFLAIMPVLVQHLNERFERNSTIDFINPGRDTMASFLAYRGFLGVYIFFVISGFVLALPFASHHLKGTKTVKIGAYFWRRLTRLEPPYIIWMTVFFLVFIVQKHASFVDYFPHYLANITYTHALFFHNWSPFNPPTWTLEVEIQFYILAPFLAYLFFLIKNKYLRRIINTAVIVLIMVSQQYFKLYLPPYSLSILAYLHYFLIGFILTDIYLCDWKEKINKHIVYDLVGVAAIVSLIYFWSWGFELPNRFLVAISLFLFFISAFKSNYINRVITNNWIMAIGGMCYTIYLIHLPFAEFLIVFTRKIALTNDYTINLLLQLSIFIPLTLILSGIFFLWFEKPFMNKNWPAEWYAKIALIFNKSKSGN